MSIINIEVRDSLSELEWIIPLQRRITIIRGFSGKGKTELVRVLIGRPAGVNINTTLPYVIVNETTWENTLLTESNKIIIIDDLDFISNLKFAGIIKRTVQNNNYYLIFGRDQIGEVYDNEVIDMYRLSYSIQSILDLVTDESGYRHFTVPHYKFGDINIREIKPNVIITEDTTKGFKFMHDMLGSIVKHSTGGKSTIVTDIERELVKEIDNIYIFVDTAAYGCHIDELYNKILRYYPVFIDLKFECFEYLLLNTNFIECNINVQDIEDEDEDVNMYCNQFISWETAFEELLEKLTSNNFLKYKHKSGDLNECWFKSCDKCETCTPQKQSKCLQYTNSKDKFSYLLYGTIFEKLLVLRDLINNT